MSRREHPAGSAAVKDAAALATSLRPLVGMPVAVRTASTVLRGTLVSCTRRSVWLVAGDADVVVPLRQIRSVAPD
jgi:hypothetical protein